MRYCLLFLILGLASCQSHDQLASPKGPIFPLNVGRWQPAQPDLQPGNAGGANEGP
ncbi:type IV secretion system lipoprotein VirB7 [Agrobacterium vitis]|uniref:Type IV secretion system lipoprotein VirB7 n=2 Tax=Agrobacterium TaxID=357 RepID=A0A2Z2PZT8_AGRTU|nr:MULTISPECIES: type IV secretion system lipoprotein VirB7 [Rhizobium/Agrobacterium group]MCF1501129.1 type IV secretion system lipoprotein VirB7 [Allorhizobium sp. Av2]ASK46342.1 type IV secretion system lipoprotein VirB7 [Agrobacterium vitis]ASK47045.1 type IV secretion system lipoprotein VirB7 [Agrobacterium radiobacter]KAA3509390.1 type IV secretion system lipoprotein VirB7 [Agrobacterium vitis]KAA3522432.1 type IV secretion system lipoprotein VirB7 [Agrobacterium vitis]